MATRNHSFYKLEEGIYWFTTSIINKQNIFITKEYLEIIIDSLKYLEVKRNIRTVLYCIMPNHLHWSFKLPSGKDNPINVYRDFKSYTAGEILKNLTKELNGNLYRTLSLFINKKVCARHLPEYLLQIFEYKSMNKKKQRYAVWKEKPDLKIISSEKFFIEKANYCHGNPMQFKWQLVDDPVDYPYSSCRFYESKKDWNKLNILNPLFL